MAKEIVAYAQGIPVYETRTAHGKDGKFVSGAGSTGGGKAKHAIGSMVTLGHPGGREIHGGKVVKTHTGMEHDASLIGKKAKVVDVSHSHVLVEHDGKRHMWPAKHAKGDGGHSETVKHADAGKSPTMSTHHSRERSLHEQAAAGGSHSAKAAHQKSIEAHKASEHAFTTGKASDHGKALQLHLDAVGAHRGGTHPDAAHYAGEHSKYLKHHSEVAAVKDAQAQAKRDTKGKPPKAPREMGSRKLAALAKVKAKP